MTATALISIFTGFFISVGVTQHRLPDSSSSTFDLQLLPSTALDFFTTCLSGSDTLPEI